MKNVERSALYCFLMVFSLALFAFTANEVNGLENPSNGNRSGILVEISDFVPPLTIMAHRGRGRGGHCGRQGFAPHEEGMGCPGRRGHGGRHGWMHRRHHAQASLEDAQCPQSRSTEKAPEFLYNQSNPLENSQDQIEKGRLLYQLDAQPSCTACHGSGDGLGMMAGGLTPPPRNFTCKETMDGLPDGQLFWIIKNGSPGSAMPSFDNLNDEQIWQLILYIRTLSK